MDVDRTAAAIADMSIRGAGRIARAGAAALSHFADNYKGNDLGGFRRDLEGAKATLLGSRPTAVSLWNGVQASTKGVGGAKDLGEAIALVKANAAAFIDASEKAVGVISEIGAKRICDGDVVMTHCNSAAALGPIIEAHRQGKAVRVYATETRPWRQGLITVRQLAEAGVDTTLIVDTAVRSVMKRVDKVFVGADTVTSHGALVNKIGTSQLALAAHEARKQFYCCAETYKFSPMTLFGDMVTIEERDHGEVVGRDEIPSSVKIFNPVFDSTPPRYIDAIITELGMISPGSVYGIMVGQLGEEAFKVGGRK
ncbi:MAG: ribose 1,5-bisphosphate isomerase [Thermoplasmatales archaeon]|nr:ribose 1,5-bisphosphate isomerase [Thermoplasmatales archaeon]